MESDDVRLARMEEGMVRLHQKIDGYHATVLAAIEPMKTDHDTIVSLKSDRKWLFVLASAALGIACATIDHSGCTSITPSVAQSGPVAKSK